jgi:4-hydroxy-tetrahydrodipicolinate synthase
MLRTTIGGVFAAVLLPRNNDGSLAEQSFRSQLTFLAALGLMNVAINGATSEYCQTTPAELKICLNLAKEILPSPGSILCGIGSGGLPDTLRLAEIAGNAGVRGLLVPPPYFFRYAQGDVTAFAEAVARQVPLPQLLYNLPQFTTGYDVETTLELVRNHSNIAGIKDSSGSLDSVRALTQHHPRAARIIGNDGVLADALAEGICDGVVSGVASVLPELIQALFMHRPGRPAFATVAAHLKTLIARLDGLPTPWGLKAIAEERGIAPAVFALPPSAARLSQLSQLRSWFRGWKPALDESLYEAKAATL